MADDPPDILIHAGFHKTGTSSLQAFLGRNKDKLSGHFHFFGKSDFRGVGARARRYGERPFPWRLSHFQRGLRDFLASLPDSGRIVLSRETFCGIMPGHRRGFRTVRDYRRTALPLAQTICSELANRYGADRRVAFLYTVRDPAAWTASIHGHLLRSIRLRDDLVAFESRIDPDHLPGLVADIRDSLSGTEVHMANLIDYEDKPGACASAVLDIMGVSEDTRATLRPVKPRNIGHTQDTLDQFLELNRTIRRGTVLKATKEALAQQERDKHGR